MARNQGRALLEKLAEGGDVRARALLAEQERIEAVSRPIGGRKKPRQKIEDTHQERLASYARARGLWFHHSPNESVNKSEGIRGWKMGVSAGFPDLLIAQPFDIEGAHFRGLMIELKAPRKNPPRDPWQGAEDTQKAWLMHWRDVMGWRVEVCHGFEAARRVLDESYPEGGNPWKAEPPKGRRKRRGR